MTEPSNKNYAAPLAVLTTLFFMWGFITCMNDILIPYLKGLFDLTHTKAMLVQFAFFGAYFIGSVVYFIISAVSGDPIQRMGYKNGMILGLLISGLGCAMFYPASLMQVYGLFLVALFIIGIGFTLLQISANPYVAILGTPETASSRLNLSQGFNSLGTTIAPIIGALVIFSLLPFPVLQINGHIGQAEKQMDPKTVEEQGTVVDVAKIKQHLVDSINKEIAVFEQKKPIPRSDSLFVKLQSIESINTQPPDDQLQTKVSALKHYVGLVGGSAVRLPYIVLAILLALLAVLIKFFKLPKVTHDETPEPGIKALSFPNLSFGMIAIFMYVGGEVAIGSILVSFFGEEHIAGLHQEKASFFLAFYWGGLMIGRFLGAVSLSKLSGGVKYGLMSGITLLSFIIILLLNETSIALYYGVFLVLNLIGFLIGRSMPARTLAVFAVIAISLILLTIFSVGKTAMWAILAVGLFNSIMWSNIFTLAIDKLGKYTSQGSSLLVMMILGGALIPVAQGWMADHFSIQQSFWVPVVCYGYILFYGLVGYRTKQVADE